jgi:hypothetical protein
MGQSKSEQVKMDVMGDWFYRLFGFNEANSMTQTKANFTLENKEDGMVLTSNVTGASYNVGTFSTPSLGELRERAL